MLKRFRTFCLTIADVLVSIPFIQASIRIFHVDNRTLFFTIFCSFRKVGFQCYSGQLKWNDVIVVLKRFRTACGNIAETYVSIPFVEAWITISDFKERRLFFTILCGFRIVRFKYCSAQLKWNHVVFELKRFQTASVTVVDLKLLYQYASLKS